MSTQHPGINALIPAYVAAAALALSGCGGGDTSTGPGPDPGRPDPDPVELTYTHIETFAGTGVNGPSEDGKAPLDTEFSFPQDLSFAPDGTPYLVDWNNHRIRIIENGVIRTVIGTGQLGDAPEGPATQAGLNHPTHISFDPQGRVIMSAWHNSKIMRYDPATGYLERICGDGNRNYAGDGGPAIDAEVDLPACTAFGPGGDMYLVDQASVRIRKIDVNGIISTVVGVGRPGGFGGDGGPADQAEINLPWGQAAPPCGHMCIVNGIMYFADTMNSCVRTIDLSTGIIETFAGIGGQDGFSGDGGPATAALLAFPTDVDVDAKGNVYICDWVNSRIRRVDTSGIITTLVGNGVPPDDPSAIPADVRDGSAKDAWLDRPFGVAIGPDQKLYIADSYNHRFRVVY